MLGMNLPAYLAAERGRTTKLARELSVPAALISQWSTGVRPVPLERCVEIEKATSRQVTCEELRPDKASYFEYLRSQVS